MKILIDGRMYRESGIGRYIRNLITQLQILDKNNEYFILHLKEDYDTAVYPNRFKKVLADFRWYGASEQIRLPKLLQELKPDLVHFPHFNVPIFYKGKFVVTIHDLIHQHFQMRRSTTLNPLIYKFKQFGYRKVFKRAIFGSEKILVPSKYVKDLLIKQMDVIAEKVVVTQEAVDDKLLAIASKMNQLKAELVLAKFDINPPFIFYVGNAHPHKNVEGLIKTFIKLKSKNPELRLVLSGHDHYFWRRIRKEFKHKDIIYTGFVDDEQLVAIYKNAKCFVLPSFEEGFGIPLLEAMAIGCPVVSSNAGALPEVGGDGAIYFDPDNLVGMENKINEMLNNESLRMELIKKGKKRVKEFSWEKLARKTMEVYSKCV